MRRQAICCLIKVLCILFYEPMCFITLSDVGMQRIMAQAVVFVYWSWAWEWGLEMAVLIKECAMQEKTG